MWGQALKPTFEIFLSHPLKIWRGKTSNFAYRRQSQARNFETAQHIDTQKIIFHPQQMRYKTIQNVGHHPTGF